MKLFIDPACDAPTKWPWFNMDYLKPEKLVEIFQQHTESGITVFYGNTTSYKPRDKMIEYVGNLFESGALSVQIIATGDGRYLPIMIEDNTLAKAQEFMDGSLAVDQYRLETIPHLEVILRSYTSSQRIVDGKNVQNDRDYQLSLSLSDGYINSRGSGRNIKTIKFDDDIPVENMRSVLNELIAQVRNGQFDLTPEHIIQSGYCQEASKLLNDLGEEPDLETYQAFCKRHNIKAMDNKSVCSFHERYSSYAAGGENTVEKKISIYAHQRRARAIHNLIKIESSQAVYPLSREGYESLAKRCGFDVISDSECTSQLNTHLCDGLPKDSVRDFDDIHALRGAAYALEHKDDPKVPVRMGGQLWEACECGCEPVYMPLHKCERCWPKS